MLECHERILRIFELSEATSEYPDIIQDQYRRKYHLVFDYIIKAIKENIVRNITNAQ